MKLIQTHIITFFDYFCYLLYKISKTDFKLMKCDVRESSQTYSNTKSLPLVSVQEFNACKLTLNKCAITCYTRGVGG